METRNRRGAFSNDRQRSSTSAFRGRCARTSGHLELAWQMRHKDSRERLGEHSTGKPKSKPSASIPKIRVLAEQLEGRTKNKFGSTLTANLTMHWTSSAQLSRMVFFPTSR